MPEIKLNKRVKYAGDVLKALVADGWNIKKAAGFLEAIPDAVDAVTVVRCKDCKYFQFGKILTEVKFCRRLSSGGKVNGYIYPEDGFCSYGERKDNG